MGRKDPTPSEGTLGDGEAPLLETQSIQVTTKGLWSAHRDLELSTVTLRKDVNRRAAS